MYCVVKDCTSVSNPNSNIVFHGIPKEPNKRKEWLSGIPIKGKMLKNAKICSLHFKKEHYSPARPKFLLPDALPFYAVETCTSQNNKEGKKACTVEPRVLRSVASDVRVRTKSATSSTFPVQQQSYCDQDLEGDMESMIKVNKVMSSTAVEQTENPLFLENEPMEAIDQDSDNSISIKSESVSMKSDEMDDLESGEEEEQDNERENLQEMDGDKDEDYIDDDESDITNSSKCSSPESEFYAETPIPVPTTRASKTTATPATISRSKTTAPLKYDPTNKLYKILSKKQQQQMHEMQRKKLKVLQNRLRRKCIRIKELEDKLNIVKNYTKYSEIENILCGNYRKLCLAINKNGVPVNYSDDVIKFAITLKYYSSEAYEFVRKYMSLPNKRMLEQYTASGTYVIDIDK